MKKIRLSTLGTALALAFAGNAYAGAVIYNPAGTLVMGVNDNGSLNFGVGITTNGGTGIAPDGSGGGPGSAGVGFLFPDGTFKDATAPGCLCEGWGVSINGTDSGYANVDTDLGSHNLSYGALVATPSTAHTTTALASVPHLVVQHTYQPATTASSTLFRSHVVISNMTGATVNDLKYVRVMDWDVPPTEFMDYVTVRGTATTVGLEESGNNGFNTANPLGGYSNIGALCFNVDCIDAGPTDHGAYFRFNFGSLADAAVYEFDIFYGAAATEAAAIAAITSEGIELYSLGQSSGRDASGNNSWISGSPATYVFGFKGVGGTPIPEPATLALLGVGLMGLGVGRRRRS